MVSKISQEKDKTTFFSYLYVGERFIEGFHATISTMHYALLVLLLQLSDDENDGSSA
jgi:hypothetical protein